MQVLKNGLDSLAGGLQDGAEFDLVVIGAGGAGLSAAVFAVIDGAKVLVIERTTHTTDGKPIDLFYSTSMPDKTFIARLQALAAQARV